MNKKEESVISIIEDNEFLRELIVKKLTNEGLVVKAAIDANEGFKRIKERKLHLILLDLVLPGIDGFGILSKLKENPETLDIPIIILSNFFFLPQIT